MKKTNKSNKHFKFFKGITKFLDKYLITPVGKFFLMIIDYFKENNNFLERFLTNKQVTIIVSLLFALITFFAVEKKLNNLVDSNAEVLYGQKVTAIYNEEAYVVEGLPKEVDVTVIGKQMDVYLAKLFPGGGVVANLQGLKAGVHKVKLQYNKTVQPVQYRLDPSEVTVIIHEKMSESRSLEVDILNRDKLDKKLNIQNATLSTDRVIIKGSKETLAKVASVKAVIDVNRIANQKVETITLKNLPIYAYDSSGNKVKVEIVSEKVEAVIKITSPAKKVPIKVVTKGQPTGKAIKSITPSEKEVTIYGDSEEIDKINEIVVELDVSGLKEDKDYAVNLVKPQGVSDMSLSTITVKLAVGEIYSKDFDNIEVSISGLAPDLKASAASQEYTYITVNVKGSEEIVNAFDPGHLKAYVDLSGLGEGTHEVELKVQGDDNRLTYTSRIKKIEVKIAKK